MPPKRIVKFKLRPPGGYYWFWVYIYEKIGDLRRDFVKFEYRKTFSREDHQVLGIVQPYTRLVIEKGKPDRLHENLGIIRLSKKFLTAEVVAHEIMHATFWQYRIESGKNNNPARAVFTDKVNRNEEIFAHTYGRLFNEITNQLHDRGYWK